MPGGHFFCVYSLLLLKLSAILVDAPRNHSTEALAAAPNPSCRRLWLTEAGLTTPTATTIRIAQRKRGAPAPAHAGPLPSAFDAAMAVLLRLEYLEDVHQPVLGKKPTPRWKKASSLSLALSFFHHLHPLLVMHYYRLFVACTLLTTAALAAPLPQAVDPAAAPSVAADGTTPTTHFDPSSFASGPNSSFAAGAGPDGTNEESTPATTKESEPITSGNSSSPGLPEVGADDFGNINGLLSG
ncbi:hypothetical protein RHOSPDRAFT_27919, partial [Rhodotorula sp. JG-1b]